MKKEDPIVPKPIVEDHYITHSEFAEKLGFCERTFLRKRKEHGIEYVGRMISPKEQRITLIEFGFLNIEDNYPPPKIKNE